MQAQVSRKTLAEGLGLLERIVPSRSSNPLLTSLKVEATPHGLTMSGTNLEIDMACFVAADVDTEAAFVVPAHLFSQIVRNLGGELVELSLQQSELNVKAGGSNFKLQTGELDAYPHLSFPSRAESKLDAKDFARSLSSVRYAASTEAFQAVFRGIKLEGRGTSARVVASDGFRLALRDFPSHGDTRNLILPARSADEIVRVLRDGDVGISYGEGVLGIITERVRMNVKLLDGEFPDYERVIPRDVKLRVILPAASLKEAVSRVAVLADKNANNRVEFLISEGKLQLAAEGDYGRAQDTLDVMQDGAEPAMSLGFNAKYVLDALGPIEGDAELLFSGPTSPAMFKGTDQGGYLAVVVPLRV
ncbi:DNA polymerase III subunit beta [Deinococcus yavapaiensis]|uniref:Beta sliding clamp n=1 Tax=Deinococcus yavapaiensis KR-236 TaxID=694435 RepID=A0A318S9B2_9DEIO|nr:DNA polymerase III subunit beta [Deinococcus yavapaiensis]PYE52797.1 DNA polymerase III beta subunit [Deinococcus yavapaiensis KR-236]